MPKNIFIDGFCGSIIAALAEDGKLLEYHVEKHNSKVIAGSVFKGRVTAVFDGMQAAFVDVGLDKNGYLYIGDLLSDKNEAAHIELPETLSVKAGDEIMVQAAKDPFGSKGVRLTNYLSFAGHYLVYMPDFNDVAVSRKITDEPLREKLKQAVCALKLEGGFVIRTAAENALKKDIEAEAKYLRELYLEALKSYETAKVGDVVYSEGSLAVRMLRDVYNSQIERVYVADKKLYEDVLESVKSRGKEVKNKIVFFDGGRDLFESFGLGGEVEALLKNRVDLSSGAYLVIDKTEALTAIDVNTGSCVGDSDLESTVFETNLLAAREIARQVRLRNIGGIIIVDFINMALEEHRNRVVEELSNALKADRAKCNVIGMTPLGLVEFTRKKKRKESISLLVKKCPYCQGDGEIFSPNYIILKIRAALLDVFADGYKSAIVDLNVEIMSYILQRGALSRDVERIWKDKRIYLIPHKTYHQEFFTVRGDNNEVLDVPDKARILY